jgi:hypothetical protein
MKAGGKQKIELLISTTVGTSNPTNMDISQT